MTHVRTSPYYPQSNGKLERYHRTIKGECIRPGTPLCLEDARRLVAKYVDQYNAWAEDRATVETDPSAVPGPEAKSGAAAIDFQEPIAPPRFLSTPSSFLAQCDKLN